MTTTPADDPGDPAAPEPGAAAEPEAAGDPTGDAGAVDGAGLSDAAAGDPTRGAGAVDGAGLSDAAAAEANGWAGAGPMKTNPSSNAPATSRPANRPAMMESRDPMGREGTSTCVRGRVSAAAGSMPLP